MAVKMAVPHDFLLGKLVILLRVFVRSLIFKRVVERLRTLEKAMT